MTGSGSDLEPVAHINPAFQPDADTDKLRKVSKERSRKGSAMDVQQQRRNLVAAARQRVEKISQGGNLNLGQMTTLLSDNSFNEILYNLFDEKEKNSLTQSEWFGQMREWTGVTPGESRSVEQQSKIDLVDLIEAITYLVCQENDVDSEAFAKIFASKNLASKVMRVLDNEQHLEEVNMEELMNFFMTLTMDPNSKLCADTEERMVKVFNQHISKDKSEIDFNDFKKLVPSKDEYFSKKLFDIFDYDNSGSITLAEFKETVMRFNRDDDDAKIEFLYQVYDKDGDGMLQEDDLRDVLKACAKENGMKFEQETLDRMAKAIFTDGCQKGADHMTLDDFKKQLHRQDGLVKNMGVMINKWLVPPREKKVPTGLAKILPEDWMSINFWTNTKRIWILIIILVNLIIMSQRVYYFSSFSMLSGYIPNFFYMTSRACGKALLFNSVLILVLVLRNSITALVRFKFAKILPLEHNIYLHKVVGITIFVLAAIHTVCHLLNFGVNVQPNPVKFLQLTNRYWPEEIFGQYDIKTIGCRLINMTENEMLKGTPEECPANSFPDVADLGWAARGIKASNTSTGLDGWLCQSCDPSKGMRGLGSVDNHTGPWTYGEWIFTTRPELFGLRPGFANPTGIFLIVILTVMFVCSLPAIRRRGHFEIFFFSHLLYWGYFVALILHAPDYWMWVIVPGTIWLFEMAYRIINRYFGAGKTTIRAGVILPSNVTNLIIERPAGFDFSAGDWVFVKVPAVSKREWHPFTISSAPEEHGTFTLHIRGVGNWTKAIHALFKDEHERQERGQERPVSRYTGFKKTFNSTVKRRLTVRRKVEADKDGFSTDLKRLSKVGSMRKPETEELNQHKDLRETHSNPHVLPYKATLVKFDTAQIVADEDDDEQLNSVKATSPVDQKLGAPLEIYVDGPFGAPASNIYRAQHAVLVGTGIGVTPFASILQSIMARYLECRKTCPSCRFNWTEGLDTCMFNLKKVDFFWINRDQQSFEWFVNLISQLEIQQQEQGGDEINRFLDIHTYVTSALQRTDMKAVALQMALDLLHKDEDRDLVTGLKAKTNAGRPNWDKVFTKIKEENKGKVTVFYCGNPMAGKALKAKCAEFGFKFRKETF